MWDDIYAGRQIRRQVRDQNGRLIGKSFKILEIVSDADEQKIATVIDQDTMEKGTLKILAKNERMCKAQIVSQIKNQKKMSSKHNFVGLKEVYEDSNTIYILMEHWGISLDKILSHRHTLMEREVQLLFCQLVDILESLRSANISHGNITLSSVLLTPNHNNIIRLTDFSHSYDISQNESGSDKTSFKLQGSQSQTKGKWSIQKGSSNGDSDDGTGSRMIRTVQKQINQYTSPQEYHQQKIDAKGLYDKDIWAVGVLLYKLLTGLFPFSDDGGKLVLNKIKNATFCFPTLQQLRCGTDQKFDMKKRGNMQFLSSEWKQLLKKMISVRNQRITLKQLINHPLKQAYFHLKDISNMESAQPSLTHLFSTKPKPNNLFQSTWKMNFSNQNEQQLDQSQIFYNDELLPFNLKNIKSTNSYDQMRIPRVSSGTNSSEEGRIPRQSIRGSTMFEPIKEQGQNIIRIKQFRIHRTQFGIGVDSQKSIDQQRHQTADPIKQKRRIVKQDSLLTPTSNNKIQIITNLPLIAKEPPYLIKFKYFKKTKWLGYILNNIVGVVYSDGEHMIGRNKQEYRYIEAQTFDSQILVDNNDVVNIQPRTIKQSIYRNQQRFNPSLRSAYGEQPLKQTKFNTRNFKSEQVSSKDIEEGNTSNMQNNTIKYTTSNVIGVGEKGPNIQKYDIYLKALDYFGIRVVEGTAMDIWVDKYWRDGNIYIFLLNTGCWQIAFCQRKRMRIYAIDQFDLSWSQDIASSDLTHYIRQIVRKYQNIMKDNHVKLKI